MTPKLFFCGDPHGKFDHVIEAVECHQPNAIILLGDIGNGSLILTLLGLNSAI